MKKASARKKTIVPIVVLSIMLILILSVFIAICFVYNHFYSKTNYIDDSVAEETTEIPSEVMETMETVTVEEGVEESIAVEQSEAMETVAESTTEDDGPDKIYNLLLIGVDRRDKTWNGNSDAMILMTINYTDKKVTLTSFMRDTGVIVDGHGVNKLNYAYAIGGGTKLVETIQTNFSITIDNYAWVEFDTMVEIIDTLGGIDLQLTTAEAANIGISIGADQTVHLNGTQALAYARDRHSGGNDYGRTQRQRNVIMAIVSKARSGGLGDLVSTANAVLPYINHNISQGDLLSLITKIPSIVNYEFVEQRVPFDDMYSYQGEMLVPDFSATIPKLHSSIYD